MRRIISILLLCALLIGMRPVPGHAQDETGRPLVVFIEDTRLVTAVVSDAGPDSLSRLRQMFEDLGARTQWQDLDVDLPEDTQVIVLARPLRQLSVAQIARLWRRLAHGANLLLAVDPSGLVVERGEGPVTANTERANSGLAVLLLLYFGIGLQDTLIIEPWFSQPTLTSQFVTAFQSYPEPIVRHPVIEPLIAPEIPVQMWGGRSITVEPFGPHSYAMPLLYTRDAYGETNTKVFPASPTPDPLEINLGKDALGHLLVGAVGENTRTRSRVVVLGDSELLQNGFGLSLDGDGTTPLFPGNWIMAQRCAAWLLDVPVRDWPPLPPMFTWLALDGSSPEWQGVTPIITDEAGDALVERYDILDVRAFRDDSFLYLLIDLSELPNPEARVTIDLELNGDGAADAQLVITQEEVFLAAGPETMIPIPDAKLVIGEALEMRIPLRVAGEGALVGQVCLADHRTPLDTTPIDCTTQPPALVLVAATEAPIEVRHPDGLRAVVRTLENAVNLRTEPNINAVVLELVPNNRVFVATGRDESGEWIQVQNAQYTGWIASSVIAINGDVMQLPIITAP